MNKKMCRPKDAEKIKSKIKNIVCLSFCLGSIFSIIIPAAAKQNNIGWYRAENTSVSLSKFELKMFNTAVLYIDNQTYSTTWYAMFNGIDCSIYFVMPNDRLRQFRVSDAGVLVDLYEHNNIYKKI